MWVCARVIDELAIPGTYATKKYINLVYIEFIKKRRLQ